MWEFKTIGFGKVKALLKNSTLVDLMSRAIFGPKLATILDFEPLGDQETIFE